MLDMIPLDITQAEIIGPAKVRLGEVYPSGVGTRLNPNVVVVRFKLIEPTSFTRWLSFQLYGDNPYDGSIRARLSDGVKDYYVDTDMVVKPVTDVDDWESQYSPLYVVEQNLDLWTQPKLQIVIASVSYGTGSSAVRSGDVLIEQPAQKDPLAQVIDGLLDLLDATHPKIFMEETLTTPRATFQLGEGSTYELSGDVEVLVDGLLRTATVVDRSITIDGPVPQAGAKVILSFGIKPGAMVRQSIGSRMIFEVPKWVLQDLVNVGGDAIGRETKRTIGAYDVVAKRDDLRVLVRGMAELQGDALAMRRSAQEKLDGFELPITSGRCVTGGLEGTVEVIPGRNSGMPEAVGAVVIPVSYVVKADKLGDFRDENGYSGNTLDAAINETTTTTVN